MAQGEFRWVRGVFNAADGRCESGRGLDDKVGESRFEGVNDSAGTVLAEHSFHF